MNSTDSNSLSQVPVSHRSAVFRRALTFNFIDFFVFPHFFRSRGLRKDPSPRILPKPLCAPCHVLWATISNDFDPVPPAPPVPFSEITVPEMLAAGKQCGIIGMDVSSIEEEGQNTKRKRIGAKAHTWKGLFKLGYQYLERAATLVEGSGIHGQLRSGAGLSLCRIARLS